MFNYCFTRLVITRLQTVKMFYYSFKLRLAVIYLLSFGEGGGCKACAVGVAKHPSDHKKITFCVKLRKNLTLIPIPQQKIL